MSFLFILALCAYLITFMHKTFYTSNINYNTIKENSFKDKLSILIKETIQITIYVYNKLKKFIIAQALYFHKILNKFNKYLLIATFIHIIILYIISDYIVYPKIKNDQNWVYTEISNQEIQEKAIEDSAPDQPDDSSEPQFAENSQENDSNSSISNGIDVFNEKIEIPTEAINFAPAPVITSKFVKTKIDFKPEQSQEKIKWGKEALYKEGKIAGINGYGSDGQGSGLGGRGAGNGSGGTGLKEGRIFGTDVKAKKLGVVFDVSFSMRPYTEMVEKEIKKSFPNAIIYYVDGCSIDTTTRSIQSFEFLSIQHVDSIYWFCDLQDPQTKDGLYILENLLKNNNIRLYIKSMDKHPNPMLKSIISSTGGTCSFGLN